MKNSMRQIAVLAVLLVAALCFTSSSEPGYDENGQDINECATYPDLCPEGYECWNLPGSYMCVGNSPFQLQGSGTGLIYYVYGQCVGMDGPCVAQCTKCTRLYQGSLIGEARNVSGTCICGGHEFKPYKRLSE